MGKEFKKSNSAKNKDIKSFNKKYGKSSPKLKRKIANTPMKQIYKNKIAKNNPKKNKEKRIKLGPLKNLYIKPSKDISKMDLNDLKKFAHKFDINPDINYQLLLKLKEKEINEYMKYIPKYRYTLHFKDALSLNCFEEKDISITLKEYNQNLINSKLSSAVIKTKDDIKSFSKLKLFNLLFFLCEQNFKEMKESDIVKKILFYSIEQTLIFKIPNKFGSIELKYYSYLLILVNGFLKFFKISNTNSQNESDFISLSNKDIIYFNFQNDEIPQEEEIDLEEFYQRKKILTDYLKGFDSEKKPEKSYFSNTKKNDKNAFCIKVSIIEIFNKNIKELITTKDDNKVLERINFIIDCFLFFKKNNQWLLEKYSNCLHINNNDPKNQENPNNYALKNLDYVFKYLDYNLFDNNAKYFLFPELLEKNIIQKDNELFTSFKKLLKHIYNSKIIKDIYYLTPEFKEFIYPFDDEDIFEELFEMTTFLPFPNEVLFGCTIKELPEILITANLKELSNYNFSRFASQVAQILNTCIHEQLKHYMKVLIFYNSFRFGISKRINSNLLEIDEERKLINSILYKINNIHNLVPLDGGEKAEIFLYGNILGDIYFSQSLELFKLSNWNKSIPEHIDNFIKCQEKKFSKKIQLAEIENNKDFCEFFKILAKKYKKYCLKKNETEIEFNYTASAGKIPRNIFENEPGEGIVFNYGSLEQEHKRTERDTNW